MERFGYIFPKMYFPQVVGDVCSLLNRTQRGDSQCSSYDMMFNADEEKGLDIRRDLRVAIGEIILCCSPKQLSSSIGYPKAEWGVVVSRSFNRSGVFEVHLLEKNTRVFRFKFVRAVTIPIHIMEMARKMHEIAKAPIPEKMIKQTMSEMKLREEVTNMKKERTRTLIPIRTWEEKVF